MPKKIARPKSAGNKAPTRKATFRVAKSTSHGYSVARGPSLSSARSAAQSAFSKAASTPSKTVLHVVPHKGSWAVRREKSAAAIRTYGTQDAAIKAAKNLAVPDKATVIIHARSGQFRDSRKY